MYNSIWWLSHNLLCPRGSSRSSKILLVSWCVYNTMQTVDHWWLSCLFSLELRLFYGPQGPYSLFAGRDASRALALMSFDLNDLTGDLEGLSPDELEVLQDWEEKFKERYPVVGRLPCEKGNSWCSAWSRGREGLTLCLGSCLVACKFLCLLLLDCER